MKGRQTILLAAALAFAIGAELWLLPGEHTETAWWARMPGFFAFFGFFVCLGLAFFASAVGKRWLQRDERYYQRRRANRD
jgi:hypothetical protein